MNASNEEDEKNSLNESYMRVSEVLRLLLLVLWPSRAWRHAGTMAVVCGPPSW